MISFFISIFLLSLILIILMMFGFKIFRFKANNFIFMGIFTLVLIAGFYANPDIYRWYSFLQQQKMLAQAKQIISQPQKMLKLVHILETRVRQEPSDAKAWFLLGRLKSNQNNWSAAHDALFQAYRLQPKNIKIALFYVETIWKTQGKITSQAKKILKDILKQDENQPDALLLLANEAKIHHCNQQAIRYWQRILLQLPKEHEMYKVLLKAIEDAKNEDTAKTCSS